MLIKFDVYMNLSMPFWNNFRSIIYVLAFFFIAAPDIGEASYSKYKLKQEYDFHCQEISDIYEHIPLLCNLCMECSSAIEIGVKNVVSTWGILQGLSESLLTPRSYVGIDLVMPEDNKLKRAKKLAEGNEISFQFLQANDMEIDIEPTDLLFIDSLHTYCHLTYELEKFSPKIQKYIAMHDTSWGDIDDPQYTGDYSEYPAEFDRSKKGLWRAVEDFLSRHPEWSLQARYHNNYGFTILTRNPI